MDKRLTTITKLGEFIRYASISRKLLDEFQKRGGIKHTLSWNTENTTYTSDDENSELLYRLIMATRPFADPRSKFHVKTIYDEIVESFPELLLSSDMDSISDAISELEKTTHIRFGNRKILYLDLYHAVNNELYFKNEPTTDGGILHACLDNPITRATIEVEYEQSLLLICDLASIVSEVLTKIRCTEYDSLAIRSKCIYCLSETNKFESEEHILPFDINHTWILPKGYVCDKCNNGVLSRLDTAFLQYPYIKGILGYFSSFKRSGKFRITNFQNATVQHSGPNMMKIIEHPSKKRSMQVTQPNDDGIYHWKTQFVSAPVSKKRKAKFKRSLLKIALGFVAFEKGHEEALSDNYDLIRESIQGRSDFNMNIMISDGDIVPSGGIVVNWKAVEELLIFKVEIFGLSIIYSMYLNNATLQKPDIPPEMDFRWLF